MSRAGRGHRSGEIKAIPGLAGGFGSSGGPTGRDKALMEEGTWQGTTVSAERVGQAGGVTDPGDRQRGHPSVPTCSQL